MKRIHWLLGAAVMLATGGTARGEDPSLTVYLQNTATADFVTLTAAKGVTVRIFAEIGVQIRWARGTPRKTDGAAIGMEFDAGAPARFQPEALAYATPFGDSQTSIHILYDRVLGTVPRRLASGLLGHVMAHEIGHVLERVDRHSATGVMKARWTTSDYGEMGVRPLAFARENRELIREYWNGRQVVSAR